MELKLLSLFSGIGAFEKALDNLNIEYKLVGFSEIDKYAIDSYTRIHNVDKTKNFGDIKNIGKIQENIDLLTYGFPCQDLSVIGDKKGFEGKKSSMVYEALRIIEENKPKITIAENVKGILNERFIDGFNDLLTKLNAMGYNSYYQILNAMDYGIPQNRERIFIVSIRKDIDNGRFKFPEPIPLKRTMFDLLEDEVEEKHMISQQMLNSLSAIKPKFNRKESFDKNFDKGKKVAYTITTKSGGRCTDNFIRINDMNKRGGVYTLNGEKFKVRRLTPKECFRLMGFSDDDFNKTKVSMTQQFKQAGNSIVVDVLEHLLKEVLESGTLQTPTRGT